MTQEGLCWGDVLGLRQGRGSTACAHLPARGPAAGEGGLWDRLGTLSGSQRGPGERSPFGGYPRRGGSSRSAVPRAAALSSLPLA